MFSPSHSPSLQCEVSSLLRSFVSETGRLVKSDRALQGAFSLRLSLGIRVPAHTETAENAKISLGLQLS